THIRICKGVASYSIENVAVDFASVFSRESHIAAIIEGLLQSLANFLFARKVRYPTLHAFANSSWSDFQLIGINCCICSALAVRVRRTTHARVSSSWPLFDWICTSGLYVCTGLTGSLSSVKAAESLYLLENVAFAVAHNPLSPLKV